MSAEYCSLGSLLEDLRDLFPPSLLGAPGWERLQAVARRLPVCVIDARFGLEFELGAPSPVADFFVVVPPQSRLSVFYQSTLPPNLAGDRLGPFIREQLNAPLSFLARMECGLILEYDLGASPPGQYGPPGVFISPLASPEPRKVELHHDPTGLMTTLEALAGWDSDDAEMLQVERVWTAFSGFGVVTHAGVMPGRGQRVIRLVVECAGPSEVVRLLERLQWSGQPSQAAAVLTDFEGLVVSQKILSLDLTPQGVLPRIGLEMFRSADWHPHRLERSAWKLVIDRLVDRGWCLPDKAEGLMQWPRLDTLFGINGMYQVRQIINHVKLVVNRGAISAKAYVGMDVRPGPL